MEQQDRVYGLHEFVAENADEVSFKVGETIRVVEKDDAYGDGWWQGTNESGETGLFPFSYTTLDKDLAMNAKALALSAGGPATSTSGGGATSSGPGSAGAAGTTMKSTMADLDQALDELQGGGRQGAGSASGGAPRRSFHSQRTANTADDEDVDSADGSEYQAQGVGARAALAAKAKANAASEADAERLEQERMKAQAQKIFEEEEERQREMLLKKEAERNQALARGDAVDEAAEQKPKVAPIAGVDMSDESDSEGSAAGLDDYAGQPQQHRSPLLGAPSTSTPPPGVQVTPAFEQEQNGEAAKDELDDVPASSGAAAAPGIEAGGLSPIPGSTNDHEASTATAPDHQQQERLSSGGIAAGVGATALGSIGAGAAALGISQHHAGGGDASQQQQQPDQQSVDSLNNRRQGSSSQADTSSVTGGATTTAPTSAAGGLDTPKSFGETSTMPGGSAGPTGTPSLSGMSRAASTVSNRPPPPPGDPRDWTVDQVVEWARGRGWDEASVVSKFAEHEISGDVLLEMDVNILKEIDISAFGKRFQVANAIKELKGWAAGGAASMQSPREVSSQSSFVDNAQPAAAASSAAAAAAGLGAGAATGLGSQRPPAIDTAAAQREVSYDRGTIITHELPSAIDEEPTSASASANAARASSSSKDAAMPSGKSLSQLADEALISRRAPSTATGGSSIPPASPRKRENSSHGLKPSGSGDRASFFSSFGAGRGRKAAPASPTGATPGGSSSQDDDYTAARKGTFSKLGLNRLTQRVSHSSGGGAGGSNDFKNQISLPTTSPTYDSMGDTARRNRTSQASNGSGAFGAAGVGAGAAGAGRPGSAAGAGGSPTTATSALNTNNGNGNDPNAGPVMSRIRPVDMEGWLRKRGDRYSVFKPRYLALKGSDLVILRDPSAPKIKGYVSMKGYKVIADENTNPGKYGFKLLHETEKPHYFSSEDVTVVREWMKGLMKATIGRDHSFPVISSYNNPTMSLKDAQRMNPPPRPPSPTSRARMQRARARENPGELTAKDQAVLAGIQQGQGGQGGQGPRAQPSTETLSRASSPAPSPRSPPQPFTLSTRRKLSFGPVEYNSSKASLVGFQYRKTSLLPPSTSSVDLAMTRMKGEDDGADAAAAVGDSAPAAAPAALQQTGGGGSNPSLASKPSTSKLTLSIPSRPRLAKHAHRSSNDLPGRLSTFSPSSSSPTSAAAASGPGSSTTTAKPPPSTSPSSATGTGTNSASSSFSYSSSTTPSVSAARSTFAWRPRTTSDGGLAFSSLGRPRKSVPNEAAAVGNAGSPLSAGAKGGRKASPWSAALHFAPRSALNATTSTPGTTTTKPLLLSSANNKRQAAELQRRPSTADGSVSGGASRRSLSSLSRDSFRPAMTSLTTLARRPSTSHGRSESLGNPAVAAGAGSGSGSGGAAGTRPRWSESTTGTGAGTANEMEEVLVTGVEKESSPTTGLQLRDEGRQESVADTPTRPSNVPGAHQGPSEKGSQGTLQAAGGGDAAEMSSQRTTTRQQEDTDAAFWKTPSPSPKPQVQQQQQQHQQQHVQSQHQPAPPPHPRPPLQVQVDLSTPQPQPISPPHNEDDSHSPSSNFGPEQAQQRILRAPKFERVLGLVPAPPVRKSTSNEDESGGARRSSTEAIGAFFAAFRGRASTSSAASDHSSGGGGGSGKDDSTTSKKIKKKKSFDLSTAAAAARQVSEDGGRPSSSDRLSESFEMVRPFPPKRVPLDYRPSPLSLSTVATTPTPTRKSPTTKRRSLIEFGLERRASLPPSSNPASDESTPAGSTGEHSGATQTVRRKDRLLGRRASVASASSSVDSPTTRTSPTKIKASRRRSFLGLATPTRREGGGGGGGPTTTPSYSPQYSPKNSPRVTATPLANVVPPTQLQQPRAHRPSPPIQLRLDRDLPALPLDEPMDDEHMPQRVQLSDPPVAAVPLEDPATAAMPDPQYGSSSALPLTTPPISLTALRMLNTQGGLGLSPPATAQAGGGAASGGEPSVAATAASTEFAMAAAAAAATPLPAPRLPVSSVPTMMMMAASTSASTTITTPALATAAQQQQQQQQQDHPKRRLGSDFRRLRLHSRRTASTSNLAGQIDSPAGQAQAQVQGHRQLRGPGVEWGASSVDEGDEEEQIGRRRRMRAAGSGYPEGYGYGSSSLGGAVRSGTAGGMGEGDEFQSAASREELVGNMGMGGGARRRSEWSGTMPRDAARGEGVQGGAPQQSGGRHTGWLGAAAFWRAKKHGGT